MPRLAQTHTDRRPNPVMDLDERPSKIEGYRFHFVALDVHLFELPLSVLDTLGRKRKRCSPHAVREIIAHCRKLDAGADEHALATAWAARREVALLLRVV